MTVASIAGSFAIGFIAGVVTANPLVGVAVGAAIGAGIGAFTASEIIATSYDVNFNRVTTCLFVIGGSALAGAAGGFAGYAAVTASFAPAEAQAAQEPIYFQYAEDESVAEEVLEDSLIQTLFGH